MSNSAFTPTQIEVTNNVPVNVPVVTAWEAYTPTFEGFGTPTSVSAVWRRNGDSIEVSGNFTAGIPTTSIATISLPSGLNLDSTKINGNGQFQILGNLFRSTTTPTAIPALTRGPFAVIDSKLVSTAKVFLSIQTNSSSGGAFDAATGQNILATGDIMTFQFRAPIAQWAGSGTTTLADRAVEEYASNTTGEGTTIGSTYSNSAFFRNGPEGSKFPNIGTVDSTLGSTKYYIQWQSTQLATDSIIIEMRYPGLTTWTPVTEFPQIRMGSSQYGISYVATSATQGYVQFGRAGSLPAGANYGATGNAWNNFFSATDSLSYYWRVRKVSGGAAVGFPVSARNIVGDTSGSVVPTGMLGETTTIATASGVNIGSGSNVFITGLTQTLSAGTWMLIADGNVSVTTPASGMTSGQNAAMDLRIQNTTDATTAASISSISYVQALSATTVCGGSGSFSLTAVLSLTSQKTFQVQGTYQSNITGGTTQIVRSARFYAVRIA